MTREQMVQRVAAPFRNDCDNEGYCGKQCSCLVNARLAVDFMIRVLGKKPS